MVRKVLILYYKTNGIIGLKNVDANHFIIAKNVVEELKNPMRGNAKW